MITCEERREDKRLAERHSLSNQILQPIVLNHLLAEVKVERASVAEKRRTYASEWHGVEFVVSVVPMSS